MKISKEFWIVVAVLGFLIAWLVDRLGGPVTIVIGSPIAFLQSNTLLSKYPFTATAIIIRGFSLFVSTMVIFSLVGGRYFTKAFILFLVGMLAEFYAIQQLTTGARLTTIQWTLSIAYGSLALVLGIVWMILMGIWASFNGQKKEQVTDESTDDESVLEPPREEQ